MKSYKAPWSVSLIVISSLVSLVCLILSFGLARSGYAFGALLPVTIVFGGLLFTIRGYTITREAILVHRLF